MRNVHVPEYDDADAGHGAGEELIPDGGYSISNPFTDVGVPRLVDGRVVEACTDEARLWVELAEVEERVDVGCEDWRQ